MNQQNKVKIKAQLCTHDNETILMPIKMTVVSIEVNQSSVLLQTNRHYKIQVH